MFFPIFLDPNGSSQFMLLGLFFSTVLGGRCVQGEQALASHVQSNHTSPLNDLSRLHFVHLHPFLCISLPPLLLTFIACHFSYLKELSHCWFYKKWKTVIASPTVFLQLGFLITLDMFSVSREDACSLQLSWTINFN